MDQRSSANGQKHNSESIFHIFEAFYWLLQELSDELSQGSKTLALHMRGKCAQTATVLSSFFLGLFPSPRASNYHILFCRADSERCTLCSTAIAFSWTGQNNSRDCTSAESPLPCPKFPNEMTPVTPRSRCFLQRIWNYCRAFVYSEEYFADTEEDACGNHKEVSTACDVLRKAYGYDGI